VNDLVADRPTSKGSSHDQPDRAPLAADEGLGHQIIDTFAVTGTSDLSWTEKICAMARPETAAW
jgi:PhoPQ-activated pathogenicity-related protein